MSKSYWGSPGTLVHSLSSEHYCSNVKSFDVFKVEPGMACEMGKRFSPFYVCQGAVTVTLLESHVTEPSDFSVWNKGERVEKLCPLITFIRGGDMILMGNSFPILVHSDLVKVYVRTLFFSVKEISICSIKLETNLIEFVTGKVFWNWIKGLFTVCHYC